VVTEAIAICDCGVLQNAKIHQAFQDVDKVRKDFPSGGTLTAPHCTLTTAYCDIAMSGQSERNRWQIDFIGGKCMKKYTVDELKGIISKHLKWLTGEEGGERAILSSANLSSADLSGANLRFADLSNADLSNANLRFADLSNANLRYANLRFANLSDADLSDANLSDADLSDADLSGADLRRADLSDADLSGADLRRADLSGADLSSANLSSADLSGANLRFADLSNADLSGADLSGVKGLCKLMGVLAGNRYWKRFNNGLRNNGYQFKVGLNELRPGEVFADDERVMCSYPGFHFASRSWCALNYPERPLEALIRIPDDAKINEPWATDGKASADKIEILQVFDVATGEDVTEQYK
jgi:uncharacterized protein YjbI with pentapeptide repeats